ncbi:helix-turn-helix transcriptional regulator [Streptomyces amakusaensis]|uniref:Helix-turn-helix domain-containing protein n=1 Tax=Streptomyces amakusaensis TaxID=67271 RepID=A0ABW0AKZ0_9ACTN
MSTRESDTEAFARRLSGIREASGRSYGALARRVGIGASTLHRYCSGHSVPMEFAPVERLARLCGCRGEDLIALHRLWVLADAERGRRAPAGPAPAPEPAPAPAPAPAREPEPEPSREPATQAPPVVDAAVPGTARRRRRWYGAAAVALATALAALFTLLAYEPLPPDPDPEERRTAAGKPGTAAVPSADPGGAPPFTVKTDAHRWRYGCDHTYLVGRAPAAVPPPPAESDARPWAGALGAVHGGETLVQLTVQGTAEKAVVLQALRVRVVARRAPVQRNAYRMYMGCGGSLTPRMFEADLDRPRPIARPVAGNDSGTEIPAVSFPYRVSAKDPEILLVSGSAARCDCDWYLELEWSSGDRSGTTRIDDGGRPFRTSGADGTLHDYDSTTRRWVRAAPESP